MNTSSEICNNETNDIAPSCSIADRQSKRFCEKFAIDDNCIICGKVVHKKVTKLFILRADRAKSFFQATRLLEDEVFIKTSLFNSPEAFMAAKFNYYASCMRKYEHEYEKTKKSNAPELMDTSFETDDIIHSVIKSIEPQILLGKIFSLSEVSNLIEEKCYEDNIVVKNEKVKSHLIQYFGESISFVYPKQRNKSQIFYYSKINPEIEKRYNEDPISKCAKILKQSLKETDFDLENRFYDENDLRFSWDNMKIPECFSKFF